MKFGDFFLKLPSAPSRPRPPQLPRCIFCTNVAMAGCYDCGAPICRHHTTIEAGVFNKCRDCKKRLRATPVEKGVLV
jgi:hypothetical protein